MFKFGFFDDADNGANGANSAESGGEGGAAGVASTAMQQNAELKPVWKEVGDVVNHRLKAFYKTGKKQGKGSANRKSKLPAAAFNVSKARITESAEILLPIPVQQIVENDNDVVSGVYEGGFKLWECSLDLARFVISHFPGSLSGSGDDTKSINVLDLGCGNGLLGVTALLLSDRTRVSFHDLNKDVIEQSTVFAVGLNIAAMKSESDLSRARFFYGPWNSTTGSVLSDGGERTYDVILTSETLYNDAYFPLLHNIFVESLSRSKSSVVLIASKRYYFGVGGGVHSFTEFVDKQGQFTATSLQSFEDGVSNIRDIVLLRWKSL